MWPPALASRCGRSLAAALLASGTLLGASAARTEADQPAASSKTDDSRERIELFLALLKRRALDALAAHRQPPPPLLSGFYDLGEGYESNVNLDGERRGDFFTQESATVTVSPRLAPWLSAELSYDLLSTHYAELRDANLWMNTVNGTLQLTTHPRLRFDVKQEYSIVNFPFDTSNSFFDWRMGLEARVAVTAWLTTRTGWTYQMREYDTRLARDAAGNDVLGEVREDRRHTVSHHFLFRLGRTSATLGGQVYRNVSNDQLEEFYDWDDAQIRLAVSRVLSPRWIATAVSSYERKNYASRSVPAITIAERDDLSTLAGSLIYLLGDYWQVTYSLTYRYQDSNDPRLDFTDWINQVRATLAF